MAVGFPVKDDYATGDVLTAANMNDLSGTLNTLSTLSGNQVINGSFDIWQRGTSFTASGIYSADRWFLPNVTGTTTVSRDTDVPTGLAGQFSIKQLTGAAASFAQWATPLENATVIPLQGRTIVVSWYMKANATWSNNFGLVATYSNSTDARASQTTSVTVTAVTTPLPTTSWARYYATLVVPTDAQGLLLRFNPSVAQASGAELKFAGMQAEVGTLPTIFKRAGGTIQGELAACQRYYYRNNNLSGATFGLGQAYSITNALGTIPFPTSMRINPTALEQTGTAANYGLSIANLTFNDCTAVPVFNTANVNGASVVFISTGVIAGNATHLVSKNSAAYLAWSAEL
jgi:hypothetical protein